MRYEINLASRPFVDSKQFYRRWGLVLGGLGLLTLVLCGVALQRWNQSREIARQIRELEDQTAAIQAQSAENQKILDDEKNRPVREQAGFLNDLILRKSYSWTRVFGELERIMPAQVHLVSMEPRVESGGRLVIGMKVAASSHEKALEFVRALETSQQFREARVLNESANDRTQTQPSERIAMELAMEYAPPQTSKTARTASGEGE